MIRLVKYQEDKVLVKNCRLRYSFSKVELEVGGVGRGIFAVYFQSRDDRDKFAEMMGHDRFLTWKLQMIFESCDPPKLCKGLLVYFFNEDERENFLSKLANQNYFLQVRYNKNYILEKYDKTLYR